LAQRRLSGNPKQKSLGRQLHAELCIKINTIPGLKFAPRCDKLCQSGAKAPDDALPGRKESPLIDYTHRSVPRPVKKEGSSP